MANIVQSVDDRSYRARADRSIQSGRIVAMDKTANEAVVDVGMINADGSPVYMHGVPFSPQTPPQINDTVTIQRTNSSPYSFTLGSGAQVGGGNSGQVVQNSGVSSIAKSGSTKLKNDVTLTGGANVTLTQSGQDISIASAGGSGTPATTVTDVAAADAVGTSTNYAREDHAHKGVHTLAKSGSTGLAGDVTLTGTGGITLSQVSQNIAIDGSGITAGSTMASSVETGTTYTFVLADAGTVVEGDNASAQTFTIPPVSSVVWPVGTIIEVWQKGAGQITIAAGAGVTLRSDTSKVKTSGQYVSIGMRMRANDEWVLQGALS